MGHPEPLFAWRSKFSGFLYKLDPNEPSKTLVAHQGKYDGPFHWKNRKLNSGELIRLQGFPVDYRFSGSRISIEKQIGNSVAPKLAQYLAKSVLYQVFNCKDVSVALLEPNENLTRVKRSRVNSNELFKIKNNSSQLELFTQKINWPSDRTKLELHKNIINNECVLKNGTWIIQARQVVGKNTAKVKIEVTFFKPVAKMFEKIICKLEINDILDFYIAWDLIHKVVNYSCSYESLQPLYGHFTEPYPQFSVKTSTNQPDSKVHCIMERMSNYSFLSKAHEYSDLQDIFSDINNILAVVKLLRSKGVDIRINETNRAIPAKHFRICYPFTLPSWQPTYTKWVDVGEHKTEDLKIDKLMNGTYL